MRPAHPILGGVGLNGLYIKGVKVPANTSYLFGQYSDLGLLLVRMQGGNRCGLFVCDNSGLSTIKSTGTDTTGASITVVVVNYNQIKVTTTNYGWNCTLLSLPTASSE